MACDREEKYESLKQEFAGMVWAISNAPDQQRSNPYAEARLVLEKRRNMQEWASCLESERLHHIQR
jgi:hypothetical protein